MRLWHENLVDKLPKYQLLGQHRECCALRGNGWGNAHKTVNYVFEYDMERLVAFHQLVMKEMENRGYHPSSEWKSYAYRGKNCENNYDIIPLQVDKYISQNENIYPEHNDKYLKECVNNLKEKGVVCKYLEKTLDI